MAWKESAKAAIENNVVQVLLSTVLLLPLIATAGQYYASGFYRQTVKVDLLFWPGAQWRLALPANVAVIMLAMGGLYIVGIVSLFRRHQLMQVLLLGLGCAVLANVLGGAINQLTGWRELQNMSSMDLVGKADRAILSLWHNPIWEELVFRGLPLLCFLLATTRWPSLEQPVLWCYFLVPSIFFALYHVPGHGPSRIVDTFLLSLGFAWMALRYGLYAVLVLHCIFDVMMVLSLPKVPNVPQEEIRWLAERVATFNTVQSVALMLLLILLPALFAYAVWKRRRGIGSKIRSQEQEYLIPGNHPGP